ncbi:MAG: sulfotransferase domain-containing protein [Phycisphaerales bacterium]
MRFPDFLIIGAMKAGTTTLYFDLLENSRVYLPDNKEPHCLVREDILTEAGRAEYAAHFRNARPDQVCGEGSTGYAKRPQYEGVAARALELCGPDLRLLYIMREPIDRIISQHYHEYTYDEAGPSIDEEVRSHERFVAFSKYAMQLRPWIETFGRDNVKLIRFDRYVKSRQSTIQEVADFLGVGDTQGPVQEEKAFNKGDRRPVHRGVFSTMYHSRLYRDVFKPFVPRSFRQWAFQTFFPRGPARPDPPREETLRWLVDQLRPDLAELREIAPDPGFVWDADELLERHLAKRCVAAQSGAGSKPQGVTA